LGVLVLLIVFPFEMGFFHGFTKEKEPVEQKVRLKREPSELEDLGKNFITFFVMLLLSDQCYEFWPFGFCWGLTVGGWG
jgi:hypothetical protein